METVKCYCCDEFETRGKAETGYCNSYMLPTWKSVVKKCQENVRGEVGDFCYYHCPFRCDFDCGQLCGEESPSVTNIHDCIEFKIRLNDALGGSYTHLFYTIDSDGKIVENEADLLHGFMSWVSEIDTVIFWYNAGWYPHYDGVAIDSTTNK